MVAVTRRQFHGFALGAGALTAASMLPKPSQAAGRAKVVIIGGGFAGVAVATRLKAANASLDVTIVEPKQTYTTCVYSNLYLGGFRSFKSLTHSYAAVKARGITVVSDIAKDIDTKARTVTLGNASNPLPYDRLVVAPGIDIKYDSVIGYSQAAAEIMPHAWLSGPQTWLLKKKLLTLSNGGLVVMTVPNNPYRCPPGPYERACMIGHFLKTRKPKSKLIVFDAKSTFSKQAVFEEAIAEYYKGIVELNLTNEIDDFAVDRVDASTGEVVTKTGRKERAALANIIPAQRAGAIAGRAGLMDGDWCPVNPHNFTSALIKDVYVLGDAAKSADMPKSAFTAISQAGVVADDILADISGKPRVPGTYRNTCWSMVAPENSAKIGADYKPASKDGTPYLEPVAPFISAPGESAQLRRDTFLESAAWYDTTMNELYGSPLPGDGGR
ncbi:MAG: flavocytochrome C [Hyphomicrobium sp.]|nr:MAG: flavocytochrome C [Hyphomicrobium sp.]PPD00113.1 MAG: flavocytochrome C [Hyphomicrobium sp.]